MSADSGPTHVLTPKPVIDKVRRFELGDMQDMGDWLATRLRDRFKQIDPRMLYGFLRGCMTGNDFMFLRSDNAAGLAAVTRRPLNVIPVIEEVFVLSRDGDMQEAALMYKHFLKWAKDMAASELIIGRLSDVPYEIVRDFTETRVLVREQLLIHID